MRIWCQPEVSSSRRLGPAPRHHQQQADAVRAFVSLTHRQCACVEPQKASSDLPTTTSSKAQFRCLISESTLLPASRPVQKQASRQAVPGLANPARLFTQLANKKGLSTSRIRGLGSCLLVSCDCLLASWGACKSGDGGETCFIYFRGSLFFSQDTSPGFTLFCSVMSSTGGNGGGASRDNGEDLDSQPLRPRPIRFISPAALNLSRVYEQNRQRIQKKDGPKVPDPTTPQTKGKPRLLLMGQRRYGTFGFGWTVWNCG